MTEKELLHEIEMMRAATAAIRKSITKAKEQKYLSKTEYGRDFATQYVIPFAEALTESTLKTSRGRATVTNIARQYKTMLYVFSIVEEKVIAAIGIKSILDCMGVSKYDKPRTAEAAAFIGRRIEDEVRTSYYTHTAPEHVVDYIGKQLSTKTSNPHYRSYGAKKGAEKLLKEKGWGAGDLFPDWRADTRQGVGLYIIEIAKRLGWVELEKRTVKKNKTQGFLSLSQALEADMLHYQSVLESYSVLRYPLVEVPRDWELQAGSARNNHSGGYYHEWIRKQNTLVTGRAYLSETELGREAINLLNILNKTAWNIDHDLFNIAKACLEKGFTIGSLKAVFHDPRLDQKMPESIAALEPHNIRRTAWRKERSSLHELLAESKRNSIRSRNALNLAGKFLEKPRFYLSWSCDYRGRMYTQQSLLHRQSSDMEKALVTFSDGCNLDERGEYWASQSLGSAFLGSKCGYEERSKWTYDNKELIKAIANDPLSMSAKWEECDSPWQFVQLCLEWNRVVLTKDKHLWDVPISSDASASGLQLLSAMRLDPQGMAWSNLFAATSSSEPPKDAYREVLRKAKEILKADTESAWMIEHLENRKLGKAILMKKVYGASQRTNRADVKNILIEEGLYPDVFDYDQSTYLTKVLDTASKCVFPKAFEVLDWIQLLFKAAKKNGNASFIWSTPNGDSIHLKENVIKTIDVRTTHLGQVRLGIEQGDTPDFVRMRNALAPSFVHSYDAAVLKASFKDWKHPLAVIHDCINVLPNDMDRAMDRVRKGFVHVCADDPLARLAEDLGVSAEQLPRLSQGRAELTDVLESTYMFN